MNTMNMPRFTAESSLYKSSERYALAWGKEVEGQVVIPQQLCFPIQPCIKPPGALLGTQLWFCSGFGFIGPLPCF
jgi:hypothetical protein